MQNTTAASSHSKQVLPQSYTTLCCIFMHAVLSVVLRCHPDLKDVFRQNEKKLLEWME